MTEEKKFGAFSSSVDPQKLSLAVTGALKAISGALVFFGMITVVDANVLIENVSQLVSLGIAAWGVVEVIMGLLRKIIVAASQK